MKKIKFVSLFLTAVLFMSSICLATPEPPKELDEISKIFSEFEETFEAGEWEEASKEVKEIKEKYEKVADYIKENTKSSKTAAFLSNLNRLNETVSAKDKEKTEEAFIELQKYLFIIMDDYNYKVHPAIIILEKYITDEAMEAAEKGDFDEVINEMNEVHKISIKITFLYTNRNVSFEKVKSFNNQMDVVKKACESKNSEDVTKELNRLIEEFNSMGLK